MIVEDWLRKIRGRLRVRKRIAEHARTLAMPDPELRFHASRTRSPFRYDCEYSRTSGRYVVTFLGDRITFIARYDRAPAALYWLSQCPPQVGSITVNLSDGEAPSRAAFAFSTNAPDVVPLPDNTFFNTRGFASLRSHASANALEWTRRSNIVRWRGQTNGIGAGDHSGPEARWDREVMPRIRMALILKGVEGTDAAFIGSHNGDLAAKLRRDGLMAARIPEADWIGDKFALDIDGTTNTWNNFLARLHLGCCVLKVASQHGFRQWYYDRVRPWEHFIPVRADMRDLVEKIEWARSHGAEARAIAENGQAFARSMTFESETKHAVAAICAANGVSPE